MKNIATITALMLLVLMCGSAIAHKGGDRPQRPTFDELDANGDLLISPEELQSFRDARIEEYAKRRGAEDQRDNMLEIVDTDQDGYINASEYEQWEGHGRRGHNGRRQKGGDCDADTA